MIINQAAAKQVLRIRLIAICSLLEHEDMLDMCMRMYDQIARGAEQRIAKCYRYVAAVRRCHAASW